MSRAAGRAAPPAKTSQARPSEAAPPRERARALALRLVAARARTEAQVRERLERAELAAEAGAAVDWLRGLGYLDDEAYARARARSLLAPGRLGPRAAERRLVAAGVDAPSARRAVAAALEEGEGEAALCRTLCARRAHGRDPAALEPKARARLARFLLGRGFSGAAVSRVLGGWDDREAEEP